MSAFESTLSTLWSVRARRHRRAGDTASTALRVRNHRCSRRACAGSRGGAPRGIVPVPKGERLTPTHHHLPLRLPPRTPYLAVTPSLFVQPYPCDCRNLALVYAVLTSSLPAATCACNAANTRLRSDRPVAPRLAPFRALSGCVFIVRRGRGSGRAGAMARAAGRCARARSRSDRTASLDLSYFCRPVQLA